RFSDKFSVGEPGQKERRDPKSSNMASQKPSQDGDLDQDKARTLFQDGALFLFLDVPEGTEFGIDYNSWHTGRKFCGVKMIPPGVHFIYFSACNKEGQAAPRTGFFHDFKQKEILVRKWDRVTEDMKDEPVSEEDLSRLQCNKEELDQYLGPYPRENHKKWVSLTRHITGRLMDRLQPLVGKIHAVCQFVSEKSDSKSRKESFERRKSESESLQEESQPSSDPESLLPQMKIVPGTEIRFSTIPKTKYPAGASPAQISKYSMDLSYTLEQMFEQFYPVDVKDVLGEIQFSFVCFLIGQVYDAFEQWKQLVHLLCTCEEVLVQQANLYMDFIAVLHFQLHEIPEDFFVDIVSRNNFLTSTLQRFFSNVEEVGASSELKRRAAKFCSHLTDKFQWDFTTEPDDYAPVIVDL
ncbi:hypothetical protein ScPMuIL_003295, partial [Solemya velum]